MTDPDRVALLADPVPIGATAAGQWWPPRWLDPAYLREHVADIDIMHVHFGFDTTSPDVLSKVCDVLAEHRIPLVVTVHDLRNPHLSDEAAHGERLDVLIAGAAVVITLTAGAAEVIETRWQRRAVVLAHPHVLPIEAVGAARTPRSRPVVGIHAKYLRANVDPWPVLDVLVDRGGAFTVRLDLDDNAMTSPRADAALPQRLARYRAAGVDVRVHPPFSDAELVDYLRELDVMVLPYRFGTHSGWVEACHDAGVCAVVPTCGHLHEQHPGLTFNYGRRLDEAGLLRAVESAVDAVRSPAVAPDPERREGRKAQRQHVRHETVRIYDRLLAEKRVA